MMIKRFLFGLLALILFGCAAQQSASSPSEVKHKWKILNSTQDKPAMPKTRFTHRTSELLPN